GVVGEVDEIGVGIGAVVHGDGPDGEVVGGPDDAQSDLTAVSDEDSGDGCGRHSGAQHRGRRFGEDCGTGALWYDERTIERTTPTLCRLAIKSSSENFNYSGRVTRP